MSFLVYRPGPPLSAYVEYFYSPAGAMPFAADRIMPMPCADLKINFGGAFLSRRAGQDGPAEALSDSWCMGVWEAYHTVTWPTDPDYIGVRFRPGGAFAVLGVEAGELANQVVTLDAVLGRFAAEVRERLYEAGGAQARFRLLETLLIAAIRHQPDGRILPALKILEDSHGHVTMEALSRTADMSRKHLISLFNRMVGVPPKAVARLYRMQHLLDGLDIAGPVVWTHVAYDHGYFDQAHFNKDFKRFTGHTPGEYLVLRQRVALESPSHGAHTRLLRAG